jgi:hypothetical protein
VNRGPSYRSAELVARESTGTRAGSFPAIAPAHAFDRIHAGTSTAIPVAKTLSRTAHLRWPADAADSICPYLDLRGLGWLAELTRGVESAEPQALNDGTNETDLEER